MPPVSTINHTHPAVVNPSAQIGDYQIVTSSGGGVYVFETLSNNRVPSTIAVFDDEARARRVAAGLACLDACRTLAQEMSQGLSIARADELFAPILDALAFAGER